MSQILHTPSEPVEIASRAVSASAKARIIKRDGKCTYPGCEATELLQVDHIVALALGGKNTDENLACLCPKHHARKTMADLKAIAKAKRRGLKHRGEFPPAKQKIKGRGFQRRWEG